MPSCPAMIRPLTTTISRVEVRDIRFPTSAGRHGSDAMHPDPDYSAAYVILHTDRPDGITGHGLMIHLLENPKAGDPSGEIQTRENHLALHANDLAGVEQLLVAHGILYRKKTLADTTIKQIFFQDPDGNVIEVGTYPPMPPFVD